VSLARIYAALHCNFTASVSVPMSCLSSDDLYRLTAQLHDASCPRTNGSLCLCGPPLGRRFMRYTATLCMSVRLSVLCQLLTRKRNTEQQRLHFRRTFMSRS